MAQATAAAPVSETKINTFMAQVYLLMSVGLAITGLVPGLPLDYSSSK